MATSTIAPLRGNSGQMRAVGRPFAENSAEDWRDDCLALMRERHEDALRMRKVVSLVEFVRARTEDVASEKAAGIVQLEVERIARRGGGDAA